MVALIWAETFFELSMLVSRYRNFLNKSLYWNCHHNGIVLYNILRKVTMVTRFFVVLIFKLKTEILKAEISGEWSNR